MSDVVVPFRKVPRRTPQKRPKAPKRSLPQQQHCPNCGWKLPTEVRADRGIVRRELVLHFECPECSSELLYVVTFEGVVDVE